MKPTHGVWRWAKLCKYSRLGLRLAAALLVCAFAAAAHAGPMLEHPAPALTATELDGHVFDLAKMHGKVVLVNYWATWCGPCKIEMPTLNAFYRRHHGEGLEIIAISTDHPEDYSKVHEVSQSLAYPVALYDQISKNGFGAPEGFPLTYVVDGNGIVRDKFIAVEDQLLRDVVLPLLRGLPHARAQQ